MPPQDVATQYKCSECKWFAADTNKCHESPKVPYTIIGPTGGLVVSWEFPQALATDWCGKWAKK